MKGPGRVAPAVALRGLGPGAHQCCTCPPSGSLARRFEAWSRPLRSARRSVVGSALHGTQSTHGGFAQPNIGPS